MPTYTYYATGVSRTDKDRARELLADVAVTPGTTTIAEDAALLSDEHITQVLIDYGVTQGIAWLADELIARYALEPGSVSIGGITVSWKDRIAAWEALARRLRATGLPVVGLPAQPGGPTIGLLTAGSDWRVR